jgi:hypothetical protein
MEDFTLGLFTKTRSSHARLNVPALVQVAAFAIGLLMILNQLGVQGSGFVHRSVQTWALTLVFLSSLVLVFIEIWCAFSLVKGATGRVGCSADADYRDWLPVGRVIGLRLSRAVQHCRGIEARNLALVMQKLPDLLVLAMLFVPAPCRRFFLQ